MGRSPPVTRPMAAFVHSWHHGSFTKTVRAAMQSVRHIKAYYFAAFLLGALIAFIVAAPLRGADDAGGTTGGAGETASRSVPDAYS